MYCLRTPLVVCLLLVHQAVSYQRPNLGHAPPADPGSVGDDAFGGPIKDDQVMWVTAKDSGVVNPNPTVPITTAELTTEVQATTEILTTKETTTELPTTVVTTKEETTTVLLTTEIPTTQEKLTTQEITTVLPTTVVTTTTTEKPITTEDPTTEKQETTENVTTEKLTTANPTTIQTTDDQKTDPPTTESGKLFKAVTTEEPTTINDSQDSTAISSTSDYTIDALSKMTAAGFGLFDNKMPDGSGFDELTNETKIFNGADDYSKIVANNKQIYVLHAAQAVGSSKTIFDPLTIGRVLGYLYEISEFGKDGPPGGEYTIQLFGGRIPTKFRRGASGKRRRASLIFTKKDI